MSKISRCGNPMPASAGSGPWRDWHRGHGCELDPEATHPERPSVSPGASEDELFPVESDCTVKKAISLTANILDVGHDAVRGTLDVEIAAQVLGSEYRRGLAERPSVDDDLRAKVVRLSSVLEAIYAGETVDGIYDPAHWAGEALRWERSKDGAR